MINSEMFLSTRSVDFIEPEGNQKIRRNFKMKTPPEDLERKIYLLKYFDDYMRKELNRDVSWTYIDKNKKKNMVHLVQFHRSKKVMIFRLSNGVLQVCLSLFPSFAICEAELSNQFNFFDHSRKVVFAENGTLVTILNPDGRITTMTLRKIARNIVKVDEGDEGVQDRYGDRIEFLRSTLAYCRDVLLNFC
jgi:cell cycle serine/threonine-protein kinase CDC5/MSD2